MAKCLAFCGHSITSVIIGEDRKKNDPLVVNENNLYLKLLGAFVFQVSTSDLPVLF